MTFWTRRKVDRLKERATEAQGRIVHLFSKRAVNLGEGGFAWGQFVDDPTDQQYGIYGTSAAVQVLTLMDYRSDHEHIVGGIRFLRDSFDKGKAGAVSTEKGDFFLIYKLAAIAEGVHPADGFIDTPCPVMDELIARALPNEGWGDYFVSDNDRDSTSEVAATASALLALRRYRPFRGNPKCHNALGWLCRRIPQNGKLSTSEVALAALALVEYRSFANDLAEYEATVQTCRKRLESWTKTKLKESFGTKEFHSYSYGGRANRYVFLLPDCITALVLLRVSSHKASRRYILDLIQFFTTRVLETGGFAPDTNQRFAAVDHLWITRLIKEFRSKDSASLIPAAWTGAPFRVRVLIILLLLVVGCWGVFFADPGVAKVPWQRIVGGVAAAIGLGLIVELVAPYFRGESDDNH